jgi:polyribonucleotide nucleotidyltransferase
MDAGVPIRRPVAGIAMGLVQEGEKAVVLSDILGIEDHLGDMDFKVAGTEDGITAVQLDNKVGALPIELLARALEQARRGRLAILSEMARELAAPRSSLSRHAPRIAILKIRPHRIRDLIGPGGRHIQDVQADTGVKIEVEDDGTVRIYAPEAAALAPAERRVRDLTGEPEVGRLYRGTVTGVKEFGCFVRLFEGIEGLVHASELAEGPIRAPSQVATEGDSMVVKVLGVDQGRIQLSRKAALGVGEGEIENA